MFLFHPSQELSKDLICTSLHPDSSAVSAIAFDIFPHWWRKTPFVFQRWTSACSDTVLEYGHAPKVKWPVLYEFWSVPISFSISSRFPIGLSLLPPPRGDMGHHWTSCCGLWLETTSQTLRKNPARTQTTVKRSNLFYFYQPFDCGNLMKSNPFYFQVAT